MQGSIWRTVPILRNSLFAQLHSTPILLAKLKNDKAQIRFAVRQKRADTKRALKDFLLYGKSSKPHSQFNGRSTWYADETSRQNAKAKNNSHDFDDIPRSKSSRDSKPNSSSSTGTDKRKSWQRKQRSYDIDDDMNPPENMFEAAVGGQKCYTWSFTWTENFDFNNARSEFNFAGASKREKARGRFWHESDDDEEESTDVGCHSHRITLGLPPTGPLKLNDIKCAFRRSALKWHPDKHQGPSQAMAEEKFKLCVNAYNSLCSAIKPS